MSVKAEAPAKGTAERRRHILNRNAVNLNFIQKILSLLVIHSLYWINNGKSRGEKAEKRGILEEKKKK
jgi:hypothetical protein